MAKAAIYAEEAKRLFVVEGFSLDAIVGMLNKKVSRKTLYNWKMEGQWEEKRRAYLDQTKDMYEEIGDIARLTIKEAKANPTPHNIYAMSKAIAALKQYQGVKVLEEETTPKERKELTEDAVKEIESRLGLV
jgi:uncharacterized protein YhaN